MSGTIANRYVRIRLKWAGQKYIGEQLCEHASRLYLVLLTIEYWGALWVLAIHLHYSPARTARHFIRSSNSKLGLKRLTLKYDVGSAVVRSSDGKGSLF